MVLALAAVFVALTPGRRRAERRLAESEAKYRLLIENQSDMVVQVDADNRFVFVNPRYCEMFGKTEDELLGQRFLPLVHPDDQESTTRSMESLNVAPHECYLEQRAKTVYGWRWLAWSDRAVVDENGSITSVIGVGQDITERKVAQQQLEGALEEKSALMAEMNHRIKNNLTMIVSLIRLKTRQGDGRDDLSDIQRQIDAIRIVHEKLHESTDVTSVVLQPYLDQLLGTIFESFADQPIHASVRAAGLSLPSRAATVIGLIVNELATNAIKHGAVVAEPLEFSCTAASRDGHCELVVANSGKPFPADVDLGTSPTLGMRIVTMLVDQLNGTIDLAREPSPEFTIRFPL